MVNLLRVRAETQNKRGYSGEASEWLELADLIESLQAQLEQKTNEAEGMRSNWYKCIESLKESQRRERAAVEYCKSPHYGDGDYYCGIDFACQGVLDILSGSVARKGE